MAPAKDSWNKTKPPRWYYKTLIGTILIVFVGIWAWNALRTLGTLVTILVIAMFLHLVMEPLVAWLVRHRIRRGAATAIVLFGGLFGAAGVLTLFGGMFFSQAMQLVKSLPEYYQNIAQWVEKQFDVTVPSSDELLKQAIDGWGSNITSGVMTIGGSIVMLFFVGSATLLVAFYLTASGHKFRAAICRMLTPDSQNEVLYLWSVTQQKISDFINSRLVLALISTVTTYIFLEIMRQPYALPVAVFVGIVSQFVPTIGTYIGGALPVLLALMDSVPKAVGVVIFIIVYQQIENLYLQPKISEKTMELNPAVAFMSVIGFGAMFGALGAFLALPVVATIQAVSGTYIRRHELVQSDLLKADDDVKAEKANSANGKDSNGQPAPAPAPGNEEKSPGSTKA